MDWMTYMGLKAGIVGSNAILVDDTDAVDGLTQVSDAGVGTEQIGVKLDVGSVKVSEVGRRSWHARQ